ncbi:MAG: hypothetical protein CMM86_10535 [Rhodovulum sp.]|nr:hypothetical protein [Rhodovulum sp.]
MRKASAKDNPHKPLQTVLATLDFRLKFVLYLLPVGEFLAAPVLPVPPFSERTIERPLMFARRITS